MQARPEWVMAWRTARGVIWFLAVAADISGLRSLGAKGTSMHRAGMASTAMRANRRGSPPSRGSICSPTAGMME